MKNENKVYIDLAIHMGWATIDQNGKIEHGHIELNKNRYESDYMSSKCLKNVVADGIVKYKWNKEKEKFCLIKKRKVIKVLNKQKQFKKFRNLLQEYKYHGYGYDIIIEEPNTTGNFASRKTLGLFGVADLIIGDYREIKASVWMKFMKDKLPSLIRGKVIKKTYLKNGKEQIRDFFKIDTKKTSIAMASFLMQKDIKDDNEADALCMMFYDNQDLFKEYKNEKGRLEWTKNNT